MNIKTGKFESPETHHKGWFRVFRFGSSIFEIWVGSRYLIINLR